VPRVFHSRRRATAIAVPSALAILVTGAFVAAPAIAASPSASPTLPFPTVCPSGSTGGQTPTPSATPSTGTPTPSASGSTTATPSANAAKKPAVGSPSPTGSATTKPSASAPASPGGTASPSPSPSSSSSSGSGGFWGWVNGVWTWIFGDAPYTAGHSGVVAADAPRAVNPANAAAGNAVAGNAPLSDRGGVSVEAAADPTGSTPTATGTGTSPACVTEPAQTGPTPEEGVDAVTIPWVMKTPSMTLLGLTFNGVEDVQVWNDSEGKYVDEAVLDFTASELIIDSMVTYSLQQGAQSGSTNTVYNNAGSGTTTTLHNVHMMTVSLTASLYGLLPQQYTPTKLPPLPKGLDLGFIPVIFTGATVQLAYLNTGSIDVPGFNGSATPGAASPQ
jgi:hypothetical protein